MKFNFRCKNYLLMLLYFVCWPEISPASPRRHRTWKRAEWAWDSVKKDGLPQLGHTRAIPLLWLLCALRRKHEKSQKKKATKHLLLLQWREGWGGWKYRSLGWILKPKTKHQAEGESRESCISGWSR